MGDIALADDDGIYDMDSRYFGRLMGLAAERELPSSSLGGSREADLAPYATNVLAYLYLPRNPIASGWVIASRCYLREDEPEEYGAHRRTVGCWFANNRIYHKEGESGHITHWVPLPSPPASNKHG